MIKKEIWGHHNGRKNRGGKNMELYDKLSLSTLVFQIMLDGWNKSYNTT